jgi:aminoglycoside 6'-N-acetyltransferase I
VRIVDLKSEDHQLIAQVGAILIDGFAHIEPHPWGDLPRAVEEVRNSFAEDRISRIAIGDDGAAIGWIGGIKEYSGHAWELHPLVVRPDRQRLGIGAALVRDFEQQVIARGGATVYLGTDDEFGATSLSGIDLYLDVTAHIREVRNLRRHPYEFYQKLGYTIVGVIPDANGFGKPDILMARRVAPEPRSR